MIKIISHFNRISGTLSFKPSNSKTMPLNDGPIFETQAAVGSQFSSIGYEQLEVSDAYWQATG